MKSPGNALQVLLVEADPTRESPIGQAIQTCGVNVVVHRVCTLAEALNYLDATGEYTDRSRFPAPSLLFIDLVLPDGSGLELLHWTVRQTGKPRIPAVIVSDSRETVDLERARKLGAHSILIKPIPAEELTSILETVDRYWSRQRHKPPEK